MSMRRTVPIVLTCILPFLLLCSACMRIDRDRTVRIDVPDMESEADVRIVTNAALNEVEGRGVCKYLLEVDVNRGVVVYHEGQRLLTQAFQRQLVESLARAGYESRVLAAGLNPPAYLPLLSGMYQDWPDRFTVVLHVPGLKSNRDADRVEDAIGYARTGDRPSTVYPDRAGKAIFVSFSPRLHGLRNFERAIAESGFTANDTPAVPDHLGEFALGWLPVTLPPK